MRKTISTSIDQSINLLFTIFDTLHQHSNLTIKQYFTLKRKLLEVNGVILNIYKEINSLSKKESVKSTDEIDVSVIEQEIINIYK